MRHFRLLWILITFLLLAADPVWAAEFRDFRKIATPGDRTEKAGQPLKTLVPVDRQAVEAAVRELFASWTVRA